MSASKARLRTRDLIVESLSAVGARPVRSTLTAVATILGVAVLIAILGITASAQQQIGKRFDALASTEIVVHQPTSQATSAFSSDAEGRAARINGVTSSTVTWKVAGADNPQSISSLPPWVNGPPASAAVVVAASPGTFQEAGATIGIGRAFDASHEALAAPVVVLGVGLARDLGISTVSSKSTVYVRGIAFSVIGILTDTQRHPDLLNAAIVPRTTADRIWADQSKSGGAVMYVATNLGAPPVVGPQLPAVLRPDAPTAFRIELPIDPRSLRESISTDFAGLYLALAGLCLLVGIVGIANTTLVSVMERVPEIGLRRALGATPRHIASQFLLESALLGAIGGLIGSSIGVLSVLLVAVLQDWTPVISPQLPLLGLFVGGVTGLLAGGYPASRAARIEPAIAVRA